MDLPVLQILSRLASPHEPSIIPRLAKTCEANRPDASVLKSRAGLRRNASMGALTRRPGGQSNLAKVNPLPLFVVNLRLSLELAPVSHAFKVSPGPLVVAR